LLSDVAEDGRPRLLSGDAEDGVLSPPQPPPRRTAGRGASRRRRMTPRRPGLDQVRVDPRPFWGLLSGDAEDGVGHAEDGVGHAEDGVGHAEDGVLSTHRAPPRRTARPGGLPQSPDDAPTPGPGGSGPLRSIDPCRVHGRLYDTSY
ncbi:hypothetical protein THAOC_25540, partial [Thalassiosira oceanica]